MPPLGYIDPGSGSLLLQALLAAILAVPFIFRRTIGGFWHRLRGTRSDEATPDEAAPADPPTRDDD